MNRTRYFLVLGAAILPISLLALTNGCKEKEEETPVATAAPTPAPTPTPTPTPVATVVPEEDAGSDAGDAGDAADAAKAVGTGDPTGIKKCCTALAQNMKSAPPDQQLGYAAALAACNAAISSPQGRQALAGVRAALRGAGAPSACQ